MTEWRAVDMASSADVLVLNAKCSYISEFFPYISDKVFNTRTYML